MAGLGRRDLAAGAASVALAGWAARAGARTTDTAGFDRALQGAVASGQIPGVVALAATDRDTLYHGAFGRRGLDRDAPAGGAMTPDSVFWIASMTKAITSVAAVQQVERGKLSLDGPIADVLPELRAVPVLEGFDAAGAPRLRPARRPITLRHLLTHTAGFTYTIWDANAARYAQQAGIPGIITCKNDALKMPLAFDPGERWDYGINIDWAGKAVERVSGQRLGVYLRENLFGPLGMEDTGFKLGESQRARLVSMHARQPDGSLGVIPFEIPQDPEFEMGGGGLYSTAADYMRFCQMFLRDGRAENGAPVLRPETVALVGQNHIGALDVTALRSVDPVSSNDAEFFPGMVKKWGLATMINTQAVPGGRGANSLNWAGLGNTYYWIDPNRRVAGVILMQLLPFADGPALRALSDFEAATYKSLNA